VDPRLELEVAAMSVAPPPLTGAVVEWPRIWLRLEGLAAFVAGVAGYIGAGGELLWLVPLLLLVDVSMAGYLAGPHPGAILYNVAHNWFTALLVLGLGLVSKTDAVVLAGFVLIAHVGMDRLAGYGLKYAPGFGDTHLGRIGRRRA
jgi:hypothetical protein